MDKQSAAHRELGMRQDAQLTAMAISKRNPSPSLEDDGRAARAGKLKLTSVKGRLSDSGACTGLHNPHPCADSPSIPMPSMNASMV